MDVAKLMTSLRVIPHAKRGQMDVITLLHGSLSKVKKGTDDLSPYGARSDLLVCHDEGFMELLFDTICNQARSLENGEWSLEWRVNPFAMIVVGGSSQACVAVGLGGQKYIRESSDEGVDFVAEIHSEDSDAIAISMPAMCNLEATCIKKDKKFLGAIFLRGSRKSVAQITNLGNIFKTNIEIDRELCPTGRGFQFMLDLVSVYYTLEQDSSLPELPVGHRAVSLITVVYTVLNHDYLRIAGYGLTWNHLATSSCVHPQARYQENSPQEVQCCGDLWVKVRCSSSCRRPCW